MGQGGAEDDSGKKHLSLATASTPPCLAVLVCGGCGNSITTCDRARLTVWRLEAGEWSGWRHGWFFPRM